MSDDGGEWDGPEVYDDAGDCWVRYRKFGDVRVRVTRYRKPSDFPSTRLLEKEPDQ